MPSIVVLFVMILGPRRILFLGQVYRGNGSGKQGFITLGNIFLPFYLLPLYSSSKGQVLLFFWAECCVRASFFSFYLLLSPFSRLGELLGLDWGSGGEQTPLILCFWGIWPCFWVFLQAQQSHSQNDNPLDTHTTHTRSTHTTHYSYLLFPLSRLKIRSSVLRHLSIVVMVE
jgi:hypothetical protein